MSERTTLATLACHLDSRAVDSRADDSTRVEGLCLRWSERAAGSTVIRRPDCDSWLALLRKTWFNLDLVWEAALVATGLITLAI